MAQVRNQPLKEQTGRQYQKTLHPQKKRCFPSPPDFDGIEEDPEIDSLSEANEESPQLIFLKSSCYSKEPDGFKQLSQESENEQLRNYIKEEKEKCQEFVRNKEKVDTYCEEMTYLMTLLTDSDEESYGYTQKLIEARARNESCQAVLVRVQKEKELEELREEYEETALVLASLTRENGFLQSRQKKILAEIEEEKLKKEQNEIFLRTHLFEPPTSSHEPDKDQAQQLKKIEFKLKKEISMYKEETSKIQPEIEKLNRKLAQLGREKDELEKVARSNSHQL